MSFSTCSGDSKNCLSMSEYSAFQVVVIGTLAYRGVPSRTLLWVNETHSFSLLHSHSFFSSALLSFANTLVRIEDTSKLSKE
jgi:hypothetical protein